MSLCLSREFFLGKDRKGSLISIADSWSLSQVSSPCPADFEVVNSYVFRATIDFGSSARPGR